MKKSFLVLLGIVICIAIALSIAYINRKKESVSEAPNLKVAEKVLMEDDVTNIKVTDNDKISLLDSKKREIFTMWASGFTSGGIRLFNHYAIKQGSNTRIRYNPENKTLEIYKNKG